MLSTLYVLFYICVFGRRPSISHRFQPKSKAVDPLFRVAIHEAGHAVVCKYSEAVYSIPKITIVPEDEKAGYCLIEYRVHHPKLKQEKIKVLLSGLAAEIIKTGKFQAKAAKADLLEAIAIVRSLPKIQIGEIKHRIPFELIFTSRIEPYHAAALNYFYSQSKELLISNFPEVDELAKTLMKIKTIEDFRK